MSTRNGSLAKLKMNSSSHLISGLCNKYTGCAERLVENFMEKAMETEMEAALIQDLFKT